MANRGCGSGPGPHTGSVRKRAPVPAALTAYELWLPDLHPAHDGVRIAHLSDIHVGLMTPASHVLAAVATANAARPDLIVMTGDYVCWAKSEIAMMREQLAGLSAAPVLATLGNHDYYASGQGVASTLAGLGYAVLRNQHTSVTVRGEPLTIVGIDDPVTDQADIAKAAARLPNRGSRIALCHCPESIDLIARHGLSLTLSGHTHGGQIYVQGITNRVFARLGKRFVSGAYEAASAQVFVTSGVGFSGVTYRRGEPAQAEVALITLRSIAVAAAA